MTLQHILVVDDSQMAIEVMRNLLSRLGYAVTTKTNPVEALGWLRVPGNLPDLIICDVMMPEMSGHDFVRQVRSDPMAAHLPVIILTANNHQPCARVTI